ncbi:zinc carboxypeptidase [Bacteriovorax sp. BSW11_IV]|uniref:M14 family zinc carboxypeptidase n=1 Tax=Bacteriovorax sp. BSW11_IV TaxID=1353529 RepID=UPI000389DDA1|nr:M14 family zinc carboxypeptidase [Bacteriovorax sp. BSW11_IV]EQC46391.1 zinc carboxypeptidase [Bacteriovorax sp. BSW11_IV]
MKKTVLILLTLVLSSCAFFLKDDQKKIENKGVVTAELHAKKEGELSSTTSVAPIKKLSDELVEQSPALNQYCNKINKTFLHWGWGVSRCKNYNWKHVRNSVNGDPLIWAVFGNEEKEKDPTVDRTMIFCAVHGDEITPVKFCFDIMTHIERIYAGLEPGYEELQNKLIIVAPIVSPDSFFTTKPSRTNARGVDLNRNFPTQDWDKEALHLWKHRYAADKRRFPGHKAMSEPETRFQVNLIRRYKPNKILSVHAPLTFLDYDGPETLGVKIAHKATQLLLNMSKAAQGYKMKNYPFFPGSLGNFAGNEMGIPTYTLELPSSDNRKHKVYWERFKTAVHFAMLHDLRDEHSVNIALKKSQEIEDNNLDEDEQGM